MWKSELNVAYSYNSNKDHFPRSYNLNGQVSLSISCVVCHPTFASVIVHPPAHPQQLAAGAQFDAEVTGP